MVVEPLMDDDNRNVSESVAAAAAKTNHCPLKFETLTGSELLPAFQFFPNVNAKKDPIANAGSCVCSTLRSLNVDIIQLGFEFVGDDIVGSYFPIVSVASLWFFFASMLNLMMFLPGNRMQRLTFQLQRSHFLEAEGGPAQGWRPDPEIVINRYYVLCQHHKS